MSAPEIRRAFKGVDVVIKKTGELYLISPSHGDQWLPEGAEWRIEAFCFVHPPPQIPGPNCGCGIYGSYDLDEALRYSYLIALVRPTIRVWPHTRGWRAAGAVAELIAVEGDHYLDIIPDQLRARVVPWHVLIESQHVPLTLEWEVP